MGAKNDAVDRIGVERLCVFGLPPVEFVNLAADLGCRYIGTSLVPMPYNPHGYPKWSLRADPALRRDMLAAMHHRGVSISLCEGFGIKPNGDVREYDADLHLMCELEIRRINVASIDRDRNRTFDQFARIAEMADALPLLAVLTALPRHIVLGLEVPQRSLAEAGVSPYDRVARCVEAACDLLARAEPSAAAAR
jgi:hypothetical protein